MTKEEMLLRVRLFLDETTEDFYLDDNEIYPALTEGQLEVANVIANHWFYNSRESLAPIPRTIQPLKTNVSGNMSTGTFQFALANIIVPTDIQWNPNDVAPASGKQCIFVGEQVNFLKLKENSLLSGGYYLGWDGTNVFVNPVSTHATAGYSFNYIKVPTDITSAVEPELNEVSHDAIVERAMWIILKDRESGQAQLHLQLYGAMLKGLMK